MLIALRKNWPEYLLEAAGLGIFMISACLFCALLEHPESPARSALPDDFSRRALMGIAMGATAVGIIYSPIGKRSGAHINPAVTLTFLRLGKVKAYDAFFYVLAQFAGGALGVALSALVVPLAPVGYVVTTPMAGLAVAFAAEAGISFFLMTVVLILGGHKWTGVACGVLVAAYIAFEAPLSGMSMNPARTVASAVIANHWQGAWIYLVAPPLAMLAAAELHLLVKRGKQ
jgi:aquaporin Z